MIHRVSSLAALLGSLAILTSACTSGASDDDVDPVDADADGFEESIDCDDADATVFPGADETCDGRDEDCDGVVDEDPVDAVTYYPDGDGDGVGTAVGAVAGRCSPPDGFVALAGDCAPDDAAVYPGAAEVCWDGRDNDCDPETHGACGLSGVISTDDAHAKMGFPIGPCRAARVGGSPSLVCGGTTLRLDAGPFESRSTPRPTLLSLAGDRDNRSFALADLVGDSAVDLVTLSGEVFEGPLGSDSTASPLLDQIEADAVHQGDLDGDGRTDVVFEYETSLVVATGPLAAGPLEDQARLTVDPGGRFKARVGDVVGDQAQAEPGQRVHPHRVQQHGDGAHPGVEREGPHVADAPDQRWRRERAQEETGEVARHHQAQGSLVETLQPAADRQQGTQQPAAHEQQRHARQQGGQRQQHRNHQFTQPTPAGDCNILI